MRRCPSPGSCWDRQGQLRPVPGPSSLGLGSLGGWTRAGKRRCRSRIQLTARQRSVLIQNNREHKGYRREYKRERWMNSIVECRFEDTG